MGYSKKELKVHIRYLKRTIKMLNRMNKWSWSPLGSCTHTIEDLNDQLNYYKGQLELIKLDKLGY